MDTLQFMFNVIKHIPSKNFRIVNFYGIYSNSSKNKVVIVQTVFDNNGDVVDPKDLPKDNKKKTRCPDCKSECLDVYLILYARNEMSYHVLALIPYYIIYELPGSYYYRRDINWENQLTEVITSLHSEFYQTILSEEYG